LRQESRSSHSWAVWRAALAANVEREKAELEAVRVQRMNQFLTNVLALPDASWYSPGAGGSTDMTVTDLLIRAGQRIDAEFADYPDIASDVHHTLGNTLRARGRCPDALRHFTRSLALRRQVYGPRHAKVAESLYFLASAEACMTRGTPSLAVYEEALAIERSLPQPTGNLPYLLLDLGGTKQYLDDFAGAEPLLREAQIVMERQFGAEDPRTAFPHNALGALFAETGDYARALEQFRIVRDIANRLPPNAEILLELGSHDDLALVVTLTEQIANPDSCLAARAVLALGELRLKLRSTQVPSSRVSHARAICHSLFTVRGEMPSASAVSSTLRPVSHRSSTTCA
jgi:tetratricopeptide (TPR) repeat protein